MRATGGERHGEISLARRMTGESSQLRRTRSALTGERHEADGVVADLPEPLHLLPRTVGEDRALDPIHDGKCRAADGELYPLTAWRLLLAPQLSQPLAIVDDFDRPPFARGGHKIGIEVNHHRQARMQRRETCGLQVNEFLAVMKPA